MCFHQSAGQKMSIWKSTGLLTGVLLALTLVLSCSKDSTETGVVARVGNEKITLEELRTSFILNPKYAIRTPLSIARQSQLQYLIDQQYYFMAARKVDLSQDTLIQKRIQYIQDNEALKFFIQETFLKNLEISPEEMRQALTNLGKSVRVKHIFSPSLTLVQNIYRRLQKGAAFDKLAAEVYSDPYLKETGGDLGYVGFGDLDPALENRVFQMQTGEISPPVASDYGYHILTVTDIRPNEQMLDMAEPMKIQLVNEILRSRKADSLIRDYLKETAGDRKIGINNRILDLLVEETRKTMEGRYNPENIFQPSIRSSDLLKIQTGLDNIRNEVLGRFGENEMTVGEFLERLKLMPPLHRPYLQTRSRMAQSVIDMFRNDLIMEQARKAGITRNREYHDKTDELVKEFLADEFQSRLYSENFKQEHPEEWQSYSETLSELKKGKKTIINKAELFSDVSHPDSVMAPEPVQLFLKNRYIW